MKWSTITLGTYLDEQAFLRRITIKSEGEWTKITCGYCRGSGMDNWGRTYCHVCHGDGKTQARNPLTRCGYCRGLGRPTAGVALTCSVCGGKGVLTLPPHYDRCRPCRGTGRSVARMTCAHCGGRGFTQQI